MLITGVIGAIAALISHFFFNAAKYEPWNYIVVLCGIALDNIMIPQFTATIKYITEALEEKEREDFSRLKVIKRQKEEKES